MGTHDNDLNNSLVSTLVFPTFELFTHLFQLKGKAPFEATPRFNASLLARNSQSHCPRFLHIPQLLYDGIVVMTNRSLPSLKFCNCSWLRFECWTGAYDKWPWIDLVRSA